MKYIIAALLLSSAQLSIAGGLINDMQSCQGLILFIEHKLDSVPSKYGKTEVKKVRDGLNAYDNYIQREIVSPGLLKFNGGNASKARQMQKQVDAYKQSLLVSFQARYPADRLYSDQAIALNECAKKAVPSGQELEALKLALSTMLELAKINE